MKSNLKKVLVLDVGGTNVKIHDSTSGQTVKVVSGPKMTAGQMVAAVKEVTTSWKYEVVSIGYPGPVVDNQPVKIMNDAAMQALGGHHGGRMLFLGLGTGLGSALVVDHLVLPLELAHLPYRKNRTYEEYLGLGGLHRMGEKKWRAHVLKVTDLLKNALIAEYVVLGGGNARLIKKLPAGIERGENSNALIGGQRLWHKL
jgi:polyphosphate glucokinase